MYTLTHLQPRSTQSLTITTCTLLLHYTTTIYYQSQYYVQKFKIHIKAPQPIKNLILLKLLKSYVFTEILKNFEIEI